MDDLLTSVEDGSAVFHFVVAGDLEKLRLRFVGERDGRAPHVPVGGVGRDEQVIETQLPEQLRGALELALVAEGGQCVHAHRPLTRRR
jgi:hypothetical protein